MLKGLIPFARELSSDTTLRSRKPLFTNLRGRPARDFCKQMAFYIEGWPDDKSLAIRGQSLYIYTNIYIYAKSHILHDKYNLEEKSNKIVRPFTKANRRETFSIILAFTDVILLHCR